MSQNILNPEDLLLAEVAVPAFFQKLAADGGVVPPDAGTADRLIGVGNLVYNTVEAYFRKEASLQTDQTTSVVKAATDAAFETAGIFAKQAREEPTAFLDVSGVRDAALLLIANNMKTAQDAQEKTKRAAEAALAAVNPVGGKADEEDEEKVVAPPKI